MKHYECAGNNVICLKGGIVAKEFAAYYKQEQFLLSNFMCIVDKEIHSRETFYKRYIL
jgi:hypothetical protein